MDKAQEIATLLKVQAARVRGRKPALTGIATDKLRKCPRHGLHNAWFTTEEGIALCLWCENLELSQGRNDLEAVAHEAGFESSEEMHNLVARVDLSTDASREAFNTWKEMDGTKEGLLLLLADSED